MNLSSPEFLFTILSIGIGAFAASKSLRQAFKSDKMQKTATVENPVTPNWPALREYRAPLPDLSSWAKANRYILLKQTSRNCVHLMLDNKIMAPFVMVLVDEQNCLKIYAYGVGLGKVQPIIDSGSFRNRIAYPIRKMFKDIKKLENQFNLKNESNHTNVS